MVEDVGPNTRAGLPYWRGGACSQLRPVMQYLFAGWDSPAGLSAVFCSREGQDWHELWRLPYGWASAAGPGSDAAVGRTVTAKRSARLRGMLYQHVPGGPSRLWAQAGAEVASLQMPESTADIMGGQTWPVTWEGYLVTGWCDFGDIALDKYFDALRVKADNLASGESWIDAYSSSTARSSSSALV